MDYLLSKQLNRLVLLAMSDNVFTDSEKETILRIGKQRGATEAEIQEVMEHPRFREGLSPMTIVQKMDFMLDCMLVVLADNVIAPEEQRFVEQTASKLGFKKEIIPFLSANREMEREAIKDLMLPYLIQ